MLIGLLKGLRDKIVAHCEGESPFQGEVGLDRFFFGARRV